MKNTNITILMAFLMIGLFCNVKAADYIQINAPFLIAQASSTSEEHPVLEIPISKSIVSADNSEIPKELEGFISSVFAKYPWISTAFAVYGFLSTLWQAIMTWWHKRVASTTSQNDDEWTKELESKLWFRIADKAFYWGGYLGSKLGGKKL